MKKEKYVVSVFCYNGLKGKLDSEVPCIYDTLEEAEQHIEGLYLQFCFDVEFETNDNIDVKHTTSKFEFYDSEKDYAFKAKIDKINLE